jgi:Type IV secretory pathway, VirD4 components
MTHTLVEAARLDDGSGIGDSAFWYRTAEKLIAPYLLAASLGDLTMAEVVEWIDRQEVGDVAQILERCGEKAALNAAWASWGREDRQRSSVYTTAETVLEPFADPTVAMNSAQHEIDPRLLLNGGYHTLYICAPSSDQLRFRPLFTALIRQVLTAAFQLSFRQGRPLHPPLLLLLDEAANIAPLPELDTIASTAAGHGIQLVTIWQDMAQIGARYGGRAETVVNNHRCKLFLSGISDPTTLQYASALAGDELVKAISFTVDATGRRSRTESQATERLLPAHSLRSFVPGEGVLIYGHLLPARLSLRPYFTDEALRRKTTNR